MQQASQKSPKNKRGTAPPTGMRPAAGAARESSRRKPASPNKQTADTGSASQPGPPAGVKLAPAQSSHAGRQQKQRQNADRRAAAAAALPVPRGMPGRALQPSSRLKSKPSINSSSSINIPAATNPLFSNHSSPATAKPGGPASSKNKAAGPSAVDVFNRLYTPPRRFSSSTASSSASSDRLVPVVARQSPGSLSVLGHASPKSLALRPTAATSAAAIQAGSSSPSGSSSDSDDDDVDDEQLAAGVLQQAKLQLELMAGLQVAEGLLNNHCQSLLSDCSVPGASVQQQLAQDSAEQLGSLAVPAAASLFARQNPLFSSSITGDGSSSSSWSATGHAADADTTAAATAADLTGPDPPERDGGDQQLSGLESHFAVLDNPVFKGRSVLQWLIRQSSLAAGSSAGSSRESSASGAVSGALAAAAGLVEAEGSRCWSVDSPQLSLMVKEHFSTDDLTITTCVAPDLSRFGRRTAGASTAASGCPEALLEIAYSQDGAAGAGDVPVQAGGSPVFEQLLSWSGMSAASASSFGTLGTLGTLMTTFRSTCMRHDAGDAGDDDHMQSTVEEAAGTTTAAALTARAGSEGGALHWRSRYGDQRLLPGAVLRSQSDNIELMARLAEKERLVRQHGLSEAYLSRTASAVLGAQLLVTSALTRSSGSGTSSSTIASSSTAAAAGAGAGAGRAGGAARSKKRLLQRDLSARMKREVWQPRPGHAPLRLEWSAVGMLTSFFYLATAVFYFYVRIGFTLSMGSTSWYGAVVLGCEFLGFTAVVPYALMLLRRCVHSGSEGLPADDGRWKLPRAKRFVVRVLIPCYKESLGTVQATVSAALAAEMPPGCSRVVYLCDDGRDPAKASYISSLGSEAVYVSGRVRKPGEINGKSSNLNNCLRNVIYAAACRLPQQQQQQQQQQQVAIHASAGASAGTACSNNDCGPEQACQKDGCATKGADDIPIQECVVVFDADMACKRSFFRHVLEVMWDEQQALCLTPQVFSNIQPAADLFNNINRQFFHIVLPGCDALGYLACTGTNFCIRARCLAQVGWFPEWTITEDYALSMELKAAGFRGRYLPLELAVGEAPEDVRSVLQQRSRWCKGHFQVFLSRKCPLLQRRLSLLDRVLYTNGTWAYVCTIITTLFYTLVPFVSLVWGVHPTTINARFALAATLHFAAGGAVNFHVRRLGDLQGMFLVLVSNHLLAFTYAKAAINTLLSVIGLKKKAGFKATDKKVVAPGYASYTAAAGQFLLQAARALSQMSVTVGHRAAAAYRSVTTGAAGNNRGRAQGSTAGAAAGAASRAFPGATSSSGSSSSSSSAASSVAGSSSVNGSIVGSCASSAVAAAGTGAADALSAASSAAVVMPCSGGRHRPAGSRLRPAEAPGAAPAAEDPATAVRAGAGLPLGEALESAIEEEAPAGGLPVAYEAVLSEAPCSGVTATEAAEQDGLHSTRLVRFAAAAATNTRSLAARRQQGSPEAPAAGDSDAADGGQAPRQCCVWLRSNVAGLGWSLDPWVLLLSLCVSCCAIGAGLTQVADRGDMFSLFTAAGVSKVFTAGHMDDFMLLAMLLAGINALPPLLFFIYLATKGRTFRASVVAAQTVNTLLFVGAVILMWLLVPPSHDLPHALRLASSFLHAQRATSAAVTDPLQLQPAGFAVQDGENPMAGAQGVLLTYPWLRAGATEPAGDAVAGGFYMGADGVKHSFPLASSTTLLAWSLLTFAGGFAEAGVLAQLQVSLMAAAQFLMDARVGPGTFVARIGNPDDYCVDLTSGSGFWGLPQDMPPNRTALLVTPGSAGGAEVLAAASAALSAAHLALRPTQPAFAAAALDLAAALYEDAKAMPPAAGWQQVDERHAAAGTAAGTLCPQQFGSSSVLDDLALAAGWLARATGNASLLSEAHAWLTAHWAQEAAWTLPSFYWPSHDQSAWSAAVLLLGQQGLQQQLEAAGAAGGAAAADAAARHRAALSLMWRGWMTGKNAWTAVVSPTPASFPWAAAQPLPTAAAVSLLGLLWAAEAADGSSSSGSLTEPVRNKLQCYALQQATYMLGSAGGSSFVVGYGRRWPQKPLHRLATCPVLDERSDAAGFGGAAAAAKACTVSTGLLGERPNIYTLQGALVSGPAADDSYADERTNSAQSAVGFHHNVPLVGLLGGLLDSGTTPGQCAAGRGLYQLLSVNALP